MPIVNCDRCGRGVEDTMDDPICTSRDGLEVICQDCARKERPRVGDRVQLTEVNRYPHFIVPEGSRGMVIYADANRIHVRLDDYVKGAEDWDNEVHWWDEEDLLAAFWRHATFLENNTRPQVGDPVWDIQDDPNDYTTWSKIVKVLTLPEEEYAADGVWSVLVGYGFEPEEMSVVFLGLQGPNNTIQTWEVV